MKINPWTTDSLLAAIRKHEERTTILLDFAVRDRKRGWESGISRAGAERHAVAAGRLYDVLIDRVIRRGRPSDEVPS